MKSSLVLFVFLACGVTLSSTGLAAAPKQVQISCKASQWSLVKPTGKSAEVTGFVKVSGATMGNGQWLHYDYSTPLAGELNVTFYKDGRAFKSFTKQAVRGTFSERFQAKPSISLTPTSNPTYEAVIDLGLHTRPSDPENFSYTLIQNDHDGYMMDCSLTQLQY
jgi:hypothetical protein